MILVTVGTNEAPFDRLLRAVDGLRLEERIVVQFGSSRVRPRGADCVDFLAYDDMLEHVRRARVVVTHAGVGSVLVALAARRRPVAVPRLRLHGEAVDDHQVAFGRRLGAAGLVDLVEDLGALPAKLSEAAAPAPPVGPGRELAEDLRRCVVGLLGEPVS